MLVETAVFQFCFEHLSKCMYKRSCTSQQYVGWVRSDLSTCQLWQLLNNRGCAHYFCPPPLESFIFKSKSHHLLTLILFKTHLPLAHGAMENIHFKSLLKNVIFLNIDWEEIWSSQCITYKRTRKKFKWITAENFQIREIIICAWYIMQWSKDECVDAQVVSPACHLRFRK